MKNRNCLRLLYFSFGIFLLILDISCSDEEHKRTTRCSLNPGCPPYICKNYNQSIFYVNASSTEDVLHFIIGGGDLTEGLSVSIIRSVDKHSYIDINWNDLISNDTEIKAKSFKFISSNYSSHFGLIFTKLFQFNSNDLKSVDQEWSFKDHIKWNKVESSCSTNGINFSAPLNSNVSLEFQFTYRNQVDRNSLMPKLQYNSNNTQFEMTISNAKQKYGLQFALVNEMNNGPMAVAPETSIDDENSPGIFKMINFYGQQPSDKSVNRSYVQWKPVCFFNSSKRNINFMSTADYDPPMNIAQDKSNTSDIIKASIAYLFLGDKIIGAGSTTSLINVTYGAKDDKFGAIIWSANFGFGDPPVDTMSSGVILLIIFGLGLPFLLVLVASIVLVVKRRLKGKQNEYKSITTESIN